MAEYIEREALLERLEVSPLFGNIMNGGFFIKDGVLDLVRRQPAADVVEVRHGEWLKSRKCEHKPCRVKNPEKWITYRCSECDYNNGRSHKANYCPNCGAKMDGKGEQ